MAYEIKNGPQDAPYLLLNPQEQNRIVYNVSDTIGTYYMLHRDLRGCVCFPFSKEVLEESGTVLLDGQRIPHVIRLVAFGAAYQVWMLGIPLTGRIIDYDAKHSLAISGFTDLYGNRMQPLTLEVITEPQEKPRMEYAGHESIALQAADEGIVLLKNEDQALPLKDSVLNVVGEGLFDFQACAVGAGKINPRYQISFRQAVMDDTEYTLNQELASFFRDQPRGVPDAEMLTRAAALSDTAVMILVRPSGENMDNSTAPGEYTLPENEIKLLKALERHFAKVVLVLNTGYPVALDFLDEIHVSALVYNGFGGMLAGTALKNVLTGRTNPSGRLTDSWANRYEDLSSAANFYECYHHDMQRFSFFDGAELTTRYDEGVFMGYRHFCQSAVKARYPFGHGLSYTVFSEQAQDVVYQPGQGVSVSVTVENRGSTAGKQVVQLYLHKPETGVVKPLRELIAFGKTGLLQPGEKETIALFADIHSMDTYSPEHRAYLLEAGAYKLYLGENAENVREIGCFEIPETIITRKTSVHLMGKRTPQPYAQEPLHPAIKKLTVKELIRLSVCAGDGWGVEGIGEAGRLFKLSSLPMRDYIAADGNSGVNLKKKNIGMPSGACLASSFNTDLMENVGKVIGEEAKELGIHLILAPGFNLHRNPLCGRNPEYFSEDPLLTGLMAAAYAKGLESTGVHACYKHLAANNAEASRKRNDSVMDEGTLRNLYLRAFEIAFRAYQPATVMTSYNRINGCYASNDPELILGVLRQEWDFKGFVMTDWSSYDTADLTEMVNAGISWITSGSSDDTYTAPLEKAAEEGRLDIRRLKENVSYLLNTVLK